MNGCRPTDYVFSRGLKPGALPINPIQITRRWRTHIKKKLGIDCDWYSLKHLNTTNNVDKVLLAIREAQEAAAKLTAHKSTKMIAKVYDIKSAQRLNDELKQNSAGFASTV
jgi:hypothetical protein